MSAGPLHVACAVEGAYDAPSAAMLHSVLTRAGVAPVHVHYLHGPAFPRASLARIAEMVQRLGGALTPHLIAPERVAALPVVPEFTVAMWYRIFLPELLPAVGRVLYLDVDTLVTGRLDELWATDLRGTYVGAVTNVFMAHHVHRPAALGLPASQGYFNSGVLLMDLDAMRRDGCTQALHDVAAERGAELEWPDQDALNLVLGARRYALHPRFNAMNSLRLPQAAAVFGAETVRAARRVPAIRHFEGPGDNKPWHPDADRADRRRYAAHLSATPWAPPGRWPGARRRASGPGSPAPTAGRRHRPPWRRG